MVKSVVVTLSVAIPDTVLSVDAVVTVSGVNYAGKVTGIITHEASGSPVPPSTTVKLTGPGLSVTP